ncbi:hypothetical protein L6164_027184 [Bauhinia variegata]|uniref:Uncharacterized protein n=1 Tax=Bauhinia variegata TaxID=167791 RepID=A0ACB9LT08_BAUVA|nr:hypothetical protein L6164_027184 [Bauhinia variegata]
MSVPSKRYSLSPPQRASTAGSTHDLKQRVITCLNKLSDRDTLAMAAGELESIARSLRHDSFSPFLNCIYNTDASSKSPVRTQCVHLLTVLSQFHGDALAPFVPKMISTLLRRLRDPDSAVRSACVDAVTAMSSLITKPPFSVAFLKPLMETLTQEQDVNSQFGAALCLAAAIESTPEPDAELLRKSTLPRLGKLVKNEVCKAKAPLLVLIGSIIGVGGASSRGVLNWLVPCLLEFLSNEDWTVRKAAAEALGKVAFVEKDLAWQYKAQCLGSFQNRRFDKIKVVRETMNRTFEMWKGVTDASESVSSPAKSTCSLADNEEGQCVTTKSGTNVGFKSSLPKKTVPMNRLPPPTVSCLSAKRESPLKSTGKPSSIGRSLERDNDKFSAQKHETRESCVPSLNMASEDDIKGCDIEVSTPIQNQNSGNSRAEIKRILFSKSSDEKVRKVGGLRSGSRVVPFHDDDFPHSGITVNNANEVCENSQDAEDLSLIREQLIQIENQQSNLLDLLQRFIGSSQSGLNSLETRVHGLERALDEMSYDLAVSSGRIPGMESSTQDMCCKLPGAEFLSSKFWKRTDGHYSTSRLSLGSIASPKYVHNATDIDPSLETFTTSSRRFQHRRGELFVNPLAVGGSNLNEYLGQYSYKTPKKMVQEADIPESNNTCQLDDFSSVTSAAPRNQHCRSSV